MYEAKSFHIDTKSVSCLASLYKRGLTSSSFLSSPHLQPYRLRETDLCWWPTDTSLTTWAGAWVDSAGNREVSGRVDVAKQWASAIVCRVVNGAEFDLCLAENTLQRQTGGKGLEIQRHRNDSFCFLTCVLDIFSGQRNHWRWRVMGSQSILDE